MVRTQLQLTREQVVRLKAIAQRDHVSMSEAARRCLDRGLAAEEPDPVTLLNEALALAGCLREPDGATDVSLHHDAYLAEPDWTRSS